MLVAAFLLLSAEPFLVWYTKTRLCLLKKRG